jgi:hypothetical protein
MFTLSVVLGSSILYKDFNAATPARLLKFIFGCLSTFIGVYLITSKRHVHHLPKHPSLPHLRPTITETAPLLVTHTSSETSSSGLGETPPHLIGTSFGYHFTDPKILLRRTSSTLPRRKRGDLASAMWSGWKNPENIPVADTVVRPQKGIRTQSESLPQEEWDVERMPGTWIAHGAGQSAGGQRKETQREGGGYGVGGEREDGQGVQGNETDRRESWSRNRGYSAV